MRVLQIGFGVFGRQRCLAIGELFGDENSRFEVEILDPAVSQASFPFDKIGLCERNFRLIRKPSSEYDLIVVSVPHHLVKQTVENISTFGNCILIEKPAIVEKDENLFWSTLGRSHEIYVGYNYRFLPHVQRLAEIINLGSLGDLRRLELFLGHGGSPEDIHSWKMRLSEVGGGVMLDPGSHCIDLALALVPELSNAAFTKKSSTGFWPLSAPQDEIWTVSDGKLLVKIQASLIEWRSRFEISAIFDDGYVRLNGRDRSYGPPTITIGRRWAWLHEKKSQRETEQHFGFDANDSIRKELAFILGIDVRHPIPAARLTDAMNVMNLYHTP